MDIAPESLSRSLEDVHRDVTFANSYRLEYIKHTMSLAGAVFVFTISFIKDWKSHPVDTWLVGIGWLAMVVSLLGGLGHMIGWDRFYISYRDYDFHNKSKEGKAERKRINRRRRLAMMCQIIGFVVGLGAIASFCLVNLSQ